MTIRNGSPVTGAHRFSLARSFPNDACFRGCSRPRRGVPPPRLTSLPHISCHHFLHPCMKPRTPTPARRRAPSLGCAPAGGELNGQGLAGCAQSSPRPALAAPGHFGCGRGGPPGLYRSPCRWFETLSASLATRRRREQGAGARRGAGGRDEALPAERFCWGHAWRPHTESDLMRTQGG